jgi:hypothetical protein
MQRRASLLTLLALTIVSAVAVVIVSYSIRGRAASRGPFRLKNVCTTTTAPDNRTGALGSKL